MSKRLPIPAVLGAGDTPSQSVLWNGVAELLSNAMKPEIGFAGAVAAINPMVAGPVIALAVVCGVCRHLSKSRTAAADKALHDQVLDLAAKAAVGRDVLQDIVDGTIPLNVEVDDLVKMDIADFVDEKPGDPSSRIRDALRDEMNEVLRIHPSLTSVTADMEILRVLAWTNNDLLRRILAILVRERGEQASSSHSPRSLSISMTLDAGSRSRDPSIRRLARLTKGELKKARAAHRAAIWEHSDRPSDDARVRAHDNFLDTMFEADLLRAEGRWHQAMPFYSKTCELEPDNVLAAVSLIEARARYIWVAKASDPGEVIDDQHDPIPEKAIELLRGHVFGEHEAGSPTLLPACWALSRYCYEVACHLGSERHSGLSLKSLERAEEAAPDNPVTLRLLARHWWVREKDAVKAEPYFKRSIEQLPADDTSSRFTYAMFLVENERSAEATPYFESCLDIDPDDPDTLGAYADLLSQGPDTQQQAERMWRHALAVQPDHPGASLSLARFLAADPSRHEEAEIAYKSALTERPGDADIAAAYALFLDDLPVRDIDTCNAYLRVCELRPHSIEAKVRARMHALAIGLVVNPDTAGMSMVEEGRKQNDAHMIVSGLLIMVLFGPSDHRRMALVAIKGLLRSESPPPPLPYLWYPKCLRAVTNSGHPFAEWLEPLSLSLAGGQILKSLTAWDVWQSIPDS